MNLEYFIAKRLIKGKEHKSSISAPIIKIAITAIALGVIMMLIAIATGVGLQRKIREKIAAFNGHIQIYNYDNNTSDVSINPISIHQDFYPEFKTIDGISHVQAVATKGGIIRTENTFEGIIAKGVGADYNWKPFEDFLVEGRLPEFSGKRNEEVLISQYLANRLKFKVGTEFWAFFLKDDVSDIPSQIKLKVVGIYNSGFNDFDANYIFIDLRHIQRMNRWKEDQVGTFEVFIDDFHKIQQKGREIYGVTLSTLDSQTIADKYYTIFEWLSLFDFNIAIIIVIMIIVGGINMITALLVLILERTQMIGLLKGLGSNNWSIRKIFLYNAAYLIAIGLFWGNVIGLGLLFLQQKYGFISLDAQTYYVSQAPVYIHPLDVIILNIGVLVLCMLMLLVPSYIITKISPARSIKFE
ncbi:ABC transporter permease [Galbibacter pacificus]|uniref:ABC transporter permease n=1 Tax=Galbibacter pacificus TaxID=2996052 RepID=A0ABT6FMI8_9FLAO|nr:FtsX-like permease family protein [Galbibacter pacificus]MDG3580962.1 ABC transporter permease [Galbibacter pacificus]MDG3584440.1 ABC transporter permease [Galbibacter pacificus]